MRILHHYFGLYNNEKVSYDVSHAIIDNSITIMKKLAFIHHIHEDNALCDYSALSFIKFSKALQCIEKYAFKHCHSLVVLLMLPLTVNKIENWAFAKLSIISSTLNLLEDIHADTMGSRSIYGMAIQKIAGNSAALELLFSIFFQCNHSEYLQVLQLADSSYGELTNSYAL